MTICCFEKVLRRVAEMQELVKNSENYLTQQQQQQNEIHIQQPNCLVNRHLREESDSGCSFMDSEAPPPGQLKHSDSLLLLTQV